MEPFLFVCLKDRVALEVEGGQKARAESGKWSLLNNSTQRLHVAKYLYIICVSVLHANMLMRQMLAKLAKTNFSLSF